MKRLIQRLSHSLTAILLVLAIGCDSKGKRSDEKPVEQPAPAAPTGGPAKDPKDKSK